MPYRTLRAARSPRSDRNIAMIGRALTAVIAVVLVTARLMAFIITVTEPAKLPAGSVSARTTRHTLRGGRSNTGS